jgi:hypothetical protein
MLAPVPVSDDSTLPPGAPVTVRLATRVPSAAGEKVTFTTHVADGASGLPRHGLVARNSAALGPDNAAVNAPDGTVPVLVTVNGTLALVVPTVCWANVLVPGVRVRVGGVTPVPLSEAAMDEPPGVAENVRLPTRLPAALGVKVTPTAQLAPAASGTPRQAAVAAKLFASAPVNVAARLPVADVPVLVTVNTTGALVVPTFPNP